MEGDVDESFYLSDERLGSYRRCDDDTPNGNDVGPKDATQATNKEKDLRIQIIGSLGDGYKMNNNVYSVDGLAPTQRAEPHGNVTMIETENQTNLVVVGILPKLMMDRRGEVYSTEGVSPTLQSRDGKGPVRIEVSPIQTYVRVRKHDVDRQALVQMLRESKKESGLTNRDIADKLGIPATEVEHWFRQDECGTIPNAEAWPSLKELLNITDDSFDAPICEFENVVNGYERMQRLYGTEGVAPTLCNSPSVKIGLGPRIRYLTPRECLRLMGQTDDAIDRIMEAEPSKTAQYKFAGNSIVVDVLVAIFKGIFVDGTFDPPKAKQVSLDSWD